VSPSASAGLLPQAIAAQRRGAAIQTTIRPAVLARADVESTDDGISVRHLDRLLGGLLLATSPRVDWAKLLHRTYAIGVLRCGRCGDRLRVLSAITEKATAKKMRAHLGLPTEPIVARPRARDPAELWASTPSMVE
jgi:hypothetical protein